MKKRTLFLTTLMLCVLIASGCASTSNAPGASITSFEFARAGYPDWNVISIVLSEDGDYRFTSDSFPDGVLYPENTDFYQKEGVISTEKVKELETIIEEYNISSWNGFSSYDDNILDGSSFSLHVIYDNGKEIKADGYEEGSDAMIAWLREVAASLK